MRRIVDEFTHLPISRQRKYQLRCERDGRCRLCRADAAPGQHYCPAHWQKQQEHMARLNTARKAAPAPLRAEDLV